MRRFIECLIPLTSCNIKCSYCYVVQQDRRKNERAILAETPENIGKALSKKRLGGVSLISLTASGETFLFKELGDVVVEILKQGHFVNITTNGSLTKMIEKFLVKTEGFHDNIHIAFSLHFVELKKKNLIDEFFKNVQLCKDAGCSIVVQINLSDEYVDCWDEIKRICKDRIGAYPQVALTREEIDGTYRILSKTMTEEEYIAKGKEMNSPLFDFTCKNFMQRRCEYCYAGYWSAKLDIASGIMTGCYGQGFKQNIYKNINKPIHFRPIGKHCCFKYCVNSSHFMSQGIIPELLPLLSYGELRNREEAGWYSPVMREFLYKQFEDENPLLSGIASIKYELLYQMDSLKKHVEILVTKLINKIRQ